MRRAALGLALATWLLPMPALPQGSPLPPAQTQFTDGNGVPLAGGTVKFCVPNSGCSTLKTTYFDYAMTTPNPNPVVLDAFGRASVFGVGAYEEQVYSVQGALILDGITTAVNGALLQSLPGQSLIGNGGASAAAPGAVAVLPPLSLGSAGLTLAQQVVNDNTNQLVTESFANTERYTSGSNALTYTLSASGALTAGFAMSIFANTAVTVQLTGADQFLGGGTSLSFSSGSNISLVTNGAGLWFVAVTQQSANPNLFPGQVVLMRGQACPAGTVPEEGQPVSRTTYAALFAAIGTVWGAGDGSTTFNVPYAGGLFNRGWVPGQGNDPGRAFGSTQGDALQNFGVQYTGTKVNNFVTQVASSTGFNSGTQTNTDGVPEAPVAGAVNAGVAPRVANETRPMNITALSCLATGPVVP